MIHLFLALHFLCTYTQTYTYNITYLIITRFLLLLHFSFCCVFVHVCMHLHTNKKEKHRQRDITRAFNSAFDIHSYLLFTWFQVKHCCVSFVTITSKNAAAITFDLYHDDDINGYNNFIYILYYMTREIFNVRHKCMELRWHIYQSLVEMKHFKKKSIDTHTQL